MQDAVVTFGKSLSLEALERGLRDQEGIGKLADLDHTTHHTVAVLADENAPEEPVHLIAAVGEGEVIPDGATLVCSGTVWITGQLQNVVAYRLS